MVVVDVPVDSSQNTVSRHFQIITLPRASSQAIGLRHKVRETLKFGKTGTTIGSRIGRITITSHDRRTSHHIILVLTIDKEEKLILQNRTTETHTEGGVMTISHREFNIAHILAFQRRTGQISIGRTLKRIGTTFGHSIHATTSKSALAHIVRSDRYRHLFKCINRNGRSTTRQR